MGEVEGVMRRTLHKLAAQALAAYAVTDRSKWILEWPGQLVLNCSQVLPCFHTTAHSAMTMRVPTKQFKLGLLLRKRH